MAPAEALSSLIAAKEHVERAKSLSRNGRHVIAQRTGHQVQLDEPEIVITSVLDVVTAARK
jgi:hypothetical protein